MDIITLVGVVTLFVLALFWIVRPIRRLPFAQRLQRMTKIPPWVVYGIVVPAFFLLFAYSRSFPASAQQTEPPNYPAGVLFVIWAAYFASAGLIFRSFPAESNVDDHSRYTRSVHIALLFVYVLLSIACIFPTWFALKHARDTDTPWYSAFIIFFLIWPVAFPRKQPLQVSSSSDWRELADQGAKLAATKAYKTQNGTSLMEAKKAVDAYLNSRKHEG